VEALLEPLPDSVPDCTELEVPGEETDESVGDEEEEETEPELWLSLDEEEVEEEAAELKSSIFWFNGWSW